MAASGSGTTARRRARAPRARPGRTGSRSTGRFGRPWRVPTHHGRPAGQRDRRAGPVRASVASTRAHRTPGSPWRAPRARPRSNGARSATLTCSAPASAYRPMPSTISRDRAGQHAGGTKSAIAPNCRCSDSSVGGTADVDRAPHRGRVAAQVVAVAVEHVALVRRSRRPR